MIIKIRKNAQITIPVKIMKKNGLADGDYLNCIYQDGIIQLVPLHSAQSVHKSKKTQDKLRINCFGRFCMTLDGKLIFVKKQKAEELIAYLVCEHGQPVSKAKICDALWHGVNMKNAMNSLCKVYQHIAKNYNYIPIFSERNRLWLDIANVETDVMEFLSLCKKQNEESDEQAVELYNGALLEEDIYDWTVQFASFYEIKYIDCLQRLIDNYAKNKKKEQSLYYQHRLKNYF